MRKLVYKKVLLNPILDFHFLTYILLVGLCLIESILCYDNVRSDRTSIFVKAWRAFLLMLIIGNLLDELPTKHANNFVPD